MKMNKKIIILSLLLILSINNLQITVGSQFTIEGPFQLSCSGAQGPVKYQVQNLPKGLRLNNNKIEAFEVIRSGYYPIKIRAEDAQGNVDQKISVVVITNNGVKVSTSSTTGKALEINQQSSSSSSSVKVSNNVRAQTVFEAPADPDAEVGTLLDSLQIPTSYSPTPTGPIGPDGRYQTIKFPTGSVNTGVNPNLIKISSFQAKPSADNRNQITSNDVKERLAFDRQLNAVKALGNLQLIIKQATANKNAAQQQTTKRQALHEQAIKRQRSSQNVITKAQTDINRVKQAISTLLESINRTKNKSSDLDVQNREFRGQRDTLSNGVKKAQSDLYDTNESLAATQKNLNQANNGKSAKEGECKNYQSDLSTAKYDRETKTTQVGEIGARLAIARAQADSDEKKVKDLQQQLAQAQNALAGSQKVVADLNAQQNSLNNAIVSISNQINDLESKRAKCNTELNSIVDRIQAIKDNLESLNIKKAQIEGQINLLSEKIAGVVSDINKNSAQNAELNNQLNQANKNLIYLRNQLPLYERVLNDAYIAGNSANDLVKSAKQNLDAAVKRFKDEQQIEQTAIKNIEIARTEKQLADQAVEALLREGAGVLPFPTAPNTNGFSNFGENGQYKISSWNQFVSNGFGPSIKPIFVGDLKTLYSMKLEGQQQIRNKDCNMKNIKSLSGYVIALSTKQFKVMAQSGSSYQVKYSNCTLAVSNKQNYSLKVGDIVVIKGEMKDLNNIEATQVAFVSN